MLQIQLKEANMQFPLIEIESGYFLLKSKVTHEELKEALDKWCEQNSDSNELQYQTSMHKSKEIPKVSCPSLRDIEDRNLKSVTNFGSVKKDNLSCVFSFKEPSKTHFNTNSDIPKSRKFDFKAMIDSGFKRDNTPSQHASYTNFGIPSLGRQKSSSDQSGSNKDSKSPSNIAKLQLSESIHKEEVKPNQLTASTNIQENMSLKLEYEQNSSNLLNTEIELDKIMRNLDLPRAPVEEKLMDNMSCNFSGRPHLTQSGSFDNVVPGPNLFSNMSMKQNRGYNSSYIPRDHNTKMKNSIASDSRKLGKGFSFDLRQEVVNEEDENSTFTKKNSNYQDSESEKSDLYTKKQTIDTFNFENNFIEQLNNDNIKISEKKTPPEINASSEVKDSVSIELEPFEANIEEIRMNQNLDEGVLDIEPKCNIVDSLSRNSDEKNKGMMTEKNIMKEIKQIVSKRTNKDKSNRTIPKPDPTENILAGLDNNLEKDKDLSRQTLSVNILEALDLTKSHNMEDYSGEFNRYNLDIGQGISNIHYDSNIHHDISPQIGSNKRVNKNNIQDSMDVKELIPSPKGELSKNVSPSRHHKKSISLGINIFKELDSLKEISDFEQNNLYISSQNNKKDTIVSKKVFSENITMSKDQKMTLPSDPAMDRETLNIIFSKNITPQSQLNSFSSPRRNSISTPNYKSNELKQETSKFSNVGTKELIVEKRPNPINQELFTVDRTGVLKQWNVYKHNLTYNWGQIHQGVVRSMVVEPKLCLIFIGGGDGSLKQFNICTKKQSFDYGKAHSKAVTAMAVSRDSRFLVTVSADCTIKQWDLHNNSLMKVKESAHEKEILSLVVHPFKDHLLTGSADEHLKKWDLSDNQDSLHNSHVEEIALIADFGKAHKFKVSALCFLLQKNQDKNQEFVFSGGDDKCIVKWDIINNQKVTYQVDAHSDSIKALKIHENILFSGGDDCKLKEWDVENLTLLKSYGAVHNNWIRGLAIIPNMQYFEEQATSDFNTESKTFSVITISEDKTMKQFDIQDLSTGEGKLSYDYRVCHDHPIVCIDYLM